MALPDELPLRCLPATSWPRADGDPAVLRLALRRWAPERGAAVGWREGDLEVAELLRRAILIRRVGGVAAVWIAVDALTMGHLERWDVGVPLLIALTPAHDEPMAAWARAVGLIAACRSSTLRFAACQAAPCHVLSGRLDVRVRPMVVASVGEHPPDCGRCAARPDCPGPGLSDADSDDVQPLPVPLSNQFDLVEQATGQPLPASLAEQDACPLAAGLHGGTEGMPAVLVAADGRLRAFNVDADAWSAEEVDRAIATHGQLYLDVSTKARLDNFAEDLRALVQVHAPHKVGGRDCPGLWRVAEQQPFAAEEKHLQQELAGLRGVVLDVGAGPLRYVSTLAPSIASGSLRYVAVEPDTHALARSAAALPGGTFIRGVGEALPVADDVADAVMLLRSYNHLRDLARALAEVARVLRPGGILLLVDNVSFGLARSAAQLVRARAIPLQATPFEHYRDHNAGEAVAALKAVGGFEIEHCVPVSGGRSNQWLVRARRHGRAKSTHPG